jgi:tetratricopeptide (TPR) repeat protein
VVISKDEAQSEGDLSATDLGMAAHAAWNRKDVDGCVEILKRALVEFPDDPTFLKFAHELAINDVVEIPEAIAVAYIRRRPKDGRGYSTLAAVLNAAYARSGGEALDLLAQVEENLLIAESLGPLDPEAELAKCNLMRFKDMPRRMVSDAYEELLQKHKWYAVAYYNYGLHCLVEDFARSLAVFRHGASLAPDDPNFVLGQMRALIKLGRNAEIWPLLKKAKQLNAPEAQVDKIMKQLNTKK